MSPDPYAGFRAAHDRYAPFRDLIPATLELPEPDSIDPVEIAAEDVAGTATFHRDGTVVTATLSFDIDLGEETSIDVQWSGLVPEGFRLTSGLTLINATATATTLSIEDDGTVTLVTEPADLPLSPIMLKWITADAIPVPEPEEPEE